LIERLLMEIAKSRPVKKLRVDSEIAPKPKRATSYNQIRIHTEKVASKAHENERKREREESRLNKSIRVTSRTTDESFFCFPPRYFSKWK
jgi:hypothetical protein